MSGRPSTDKYFKINDFVVLFLHHFKIEPKGFVRLFKKKSSKLKMALVSAFTSDKAQQAL